MFKLTNQWTIKIRIRLNDKVYNYVNCQRVAHFIRPLIVLKTAVR